MQPYLSTESASSSLCPTIHPGLDSNGQPLHKDMGAKIAVTAWGKMLKLDEVDATRIQAFIEKYEGINNHGAG